MRRTAIGATLVISVFHAASLAAQPIDGSKPILCVVSHISSCADGSTCQQETPETANLPRFLHVDVAGKTLSGTAPDNRQRTTPIETVQQRNERLVLQGTDEGPLTWSLDIGSGTGDMVLAGIKDGVGFVVFGACTD